MSWDAHFEENAGAAHDEIVARRAEGGGVLDEENAASIWGLFRDFLAEEAPVSAACRLSAEMFSRVFNKEVSYVPFLGLHASFSAGLAGFAPLRVEARGGAGAAPGRDVAVEAGGRHGRVVYGPAGETARSILVFRSILPNVHTFLRMLDMFESHYFGADVKDGGEPASALNPTRKNRIPFFNRVGTGAQKGAATALVTRGVHVECGHDLARLERRLSRLRRREIGQI